jgi:hypothetical protein
MGYEQMMAVTAPRIAGAEAVAALTARMKLDATGEVGDPEVRHALDRVVAAMTVPGLFEDLDETERQSAIGTVTSFIKQALELIENPGRSGGWVYTDPRCCRARVRARAQFLRSSRAWRPPWMASTRLWLARAHASSISARALPPCRSPAAACGRPRRSSASIRGSPRWSSPAGTCLMRVSRTASSSARSPSRTSRTSMSSTWLGCPLPSCRGPCWSPACRLSPGACAQAGGSSSVDMPHPKRRSRRRSPICGRCVAVARLCRTMKRWRSSSGGSEQRAIGAQRLGRADPIRRRSAPLTQVRSGRGR